MRHPYPLSFAGCGGLCNGGLSPIAKWSKAAAAPNGNAKTKCLAVGSSIFWMVPILWMISGGNHTLRISRAGAHVPYFIYGRLAAAAFAPMV